MRALAFFLAVVLFVAAGCTRELVPPLVEVNELTPRLVEPGDRAEIRGSGFPQGRTALLRFSGVVRRPGQKPENVAIEATGSAVHDDRVEIAWSELLVERFCGRGDRAAHATFEGDIEVAFASSVAGAPPLSGTLRGVSLDVQPSSIPPAIAEARTNEGNRLLAFLGIVPGVPTARGLPAEVVERGSIAERAGILAGDIVSSFEGVHVLSPMDIAVTSSRSASIGVLHGDIVEEDVRTVPLVGFASEGIPVEYVPALLVVGFALALLAVLGMPGPLWLAMMEARVASRLRGASIRSLAAALFGGGHALSISLIGTALVAAFALGPHLFGRELDGIVLMVSSAVLLVASRVMQTSGLRSAAATALDLLPLALVMAAAMVAMVVLTGAMDLGELVRAQGGAPWRFAAAQKPAAAVLAALHLTTVVAVLRVREGQKARPSARLVERLGVLAASALAVAVFFGGWQVPGAPAPSSLVLLVVGAVAFVVKTWILTAALTGIGALGGARRPSEARSHALRRLGPAALAAAALVVAWRKLAPEPALETAFGATAVAVAVLVLVRCAARVRAVLVRPPAHASPFL